MADWRDKLKGLASEEGKKDFEAKKKQDNKSGFTYTPAPKGKGNGYKGNNKPGNNKPGNNKPQNGGRPQNRPYNVGPVTVPYNFVPMTDKAVGAPLSRRAEKGLVSAEAYAAYLQECGKNSGYIDIELLTLTPTCINSDSTFFAPNGKPVIPGSTLRGMVKNYLKMLSCGTVRAEENEDMTSRHLYYRDIASSIKELKNHYMDKMTEKTMVEVKGKMEQRPEAKAKAGILVRLEDNSYGIIPADFTTEPYEKKKLPNGKYVINIDRMGNKKYEYIIPSYLTYGENKNGCIQVTRDYIDCHTGAMRGKGHYYRISNPDWTRLIRVSPELLEDYKADKNRKGLNLLDERNKKINISQQDFFRGHKFKHAAPCFYVAKENEALHFGYGKYYRIPYDKAIEDHIPEAVKTDAVIDFATALFGSKDNFAGRVFFEDAVHVEGGKLLKPSKSHNLMGPNPTSFQLYLEQPGGGLKHWDDDTKLRGYKLYWHNAIGEDDWRFTEGKDINVKGTEPIEPISAQAKFCGRIRFEKLSDEELGALLAVLELGQKGCFKLGMGKSLGMGSIKLSAELCLIDQQARYGSLFNQGAWTSGTEQKVAAAKFTAAFAAYMQKQTELLGIAKGYQKVKEALELMLSWEKRPNPEQLAYMSVGDDRYKKRVVLETPDKLAKK